LTNLGNILTLRYDPTSSQGRGGQDLSIRSITPDELSHLRQVFSIDSNNVPTSQKLESEIRRIIKNSIEESKRKRIAVALSSGVDSNVIFSLIRKEFPSIEIDCINVTFDEDSEATRSRAIAESKGAEFHEIHVDNPLKDLPAILSIIKEPRWNVYQYYFIKKASSASNLIFTGDGGDELFAGYTFRYKKFLEMASTHSSIEEKIRIYLQCHERDWVPDQVDMFEGTQTHFKWDSIYRLLEKYFDNSLEPLEQVLLADYHGKLMYDFIPTNEKLFKHFNLTGVAPLLGGQIIDLSMKIPSSLKYDLDANIGKIQLRKIIKQNIPEFHEEDGKRGFGMDLPGLWDRVGKETVISNLDKGRIFEDKLISKEWYRNSITKINENREEATRYISKMLQLLSLEVWYRLFVTSEMKANHAI
jgi:asparagine synthase (glutamine-hydrolysing)